jgi:hypothetical protein
MQWPEILKLFGGTAVLLAGLLAALAWFVRVFVTHQLDVRLEKWKEQHETRLEYVRAALVRMDHLETDLIQSRGEAYGEIWSLTGCMSVFAAVKPISAAELSSKLSHWWFAQGWLLTEDSRVRIFLIQEVLNFFMLRSLSFRRPPEEQLFGSPTHTIDVLRAMRTEQLGIEPREDDGRYSLKELRGCVAAWKSKRINATRDTTTPEQAWILIQFLMSAFRTHLVQDLKSREIFSGPKSERLSDAKTPAPS